jgi:predicted outer membrane lipoprotein
MFRLVGILLMAAVGIIMFVLLVTAHPLSVLLASAFMVAACVIANLTDRHNHRS